MCPGGLWPGEGGGGEGGAGARQGLPTGGAGMGCHAPPQGKSIDWCMERKEELGGQVGTTKFSLQTYLLLHFKNPKGAVTMNL